MPGGGILASLSEGMQETLYPRVMEWDRRWSNLWNLMGFGPPEAVEFGRDWLIRKIVSFGLAGNVQPEAAVTGIAAMISSDGFNGQIYGSGAGSIFPNLEYATAPGDYEFQVGFSKIAGTLDVPLETIRASQMKSHIEAPMIERVLDGTAKNVSLLKTNLLVAETEVIGPDQSGNAYTVLESMVLAKATIDSISDWAPYTARTFTLLSGSINRFQDGQLVDLLVIDGVTANQINVVNSEPKTGTVAIPLMVHATDGLSNTLALVNVHPTITFELSGIGASINATQFFLIPHGLLPTAVGSSTRPSILRRQTDIGAATPGNSTIVTLTAGGTVGIVDMPAFIGMTNDKIDLLTPQGPFGIEKLMKKNKFVIGGVETQLYGLYSELYGNQYSTGATTSGGGLSFTRFPVYKAYDRNIGGAVLDELTLFGIAALYARGKGPFYRIGVWALAEGGLAAYASSGISGLHTYERNARNVTINAGFSNISDEGEGFQFSAFGSKPQVTSDPFVGDGKAYGLITADKNWRVFTPPRLKGARSSAGFEGPVEFITPFISGGQSLFRGYNNTTLQVSEFWMPYQIMQWESMGGGIVLRGVGGSYAAYN